MTPEQYRRAIARLGMTQVGSADVLGTNPRTVRRWISGDHTIPGSVAILLRLMLRGRITVEEVERISIAETKAAEREREQA